MPASFDNSGKPAYMYDSVGDTWYAFGAKIDTASAYEWTNTQLYLNTVTFDADVVMKDGFNNFLNPAARDAAITSPVRGTICFVRQDAGGNSINQIQYYSGSAWTANDGDISQVSAGTGLSGGGTAGNVTLSVDTTVVATTNNTLTMSNKTLTAPRFGSAGEIDDANGNELIKFPATVASAVNEITITNATTSGTPSISATGDDTNISLNLVAKGSGTVQAGGVAIATISGTQTLTGKTISATNNTLTNIGNASLTNSSITINGSAVSLGGSVTISGESFSPFMLIGA